MAAMSDYLEQGIANLIFRAVAFTPPAQLFIALYTSDPQDDNSGTEVSGNGYARMLVAFDVPVGGATQNSATITHPTATGDDWGPITHAALFDALSGGNMLLHGALTTPRTILVGDSFRWTAGEIDGAFA